MTDKLHEKIRAVVERAVDKAKRDYDRKLEAENARHQARRDALAAELTATIEAARAALPPTPEAPTCATGEHLYTQDGACIDGDAAIDPTQIPEALTRPYVPRGAR